MPITKFLSRCENCHNEMVVFEGKYGVFCSECAKLVAGIYKYEKKKIFALIPAKKEYTIINNKYWEGICPKCSKLKILFHSKYGDYCKPCTMNMGESIKRKKTNKYPQRYWQGICQDCKESKTIFNSKYGIICSDCAAIASKKNGWQKQMAEDRIGPAKNYNRRQGECGRCHQHTKIFNSKYGILCSECATNTRAEYYFAKNNNGAARQRRDRRSGECSKCHLITEIFDSKHGVGLCSCCALELSGEKRNNRKKEERAKTSKRFFGICSNCLQQDSIFRGKYGDLCNMCGDFARGRAHRANQRKGDHLKHRPGNCESCQQDTIIFNSKYGNICSECANTVAIDLYQATQQDRIQETRRKRDRRKWRNDPAYKLRKIVASQVRRILTQNGSCKGGKSILQYLPYKSMDELKQIIESKFEPWMNWNNWTIYRADKHKDDDPSTWVWHLDHIETQSEHQYASMNDENFKKMWASENLRPLQGKQNILDGVNRTRHQNKSRKKVKK